MSCIACGGETHDWFGDPWCDKCHGVMVNTSSGTYRIFRHVCTARGEKFGLPVVWDESSKNYLFRWPNKVNPRSVSPGAENDVLDGLDFKPTPVLSSFGSSLDSVLIQAYDAVRVEGGPRPELDCAPSSTESERALILGV